MKKFKYTTSFSSVIRCTTDKEDNKFLAKASIEDLKQIIPSDALNDGKEDLLPIASNMFVANLANKNGDMVDTDVALNLMPSIPHKLIDVEHERSQIVGHMTNAAISKFDSNYAVGIGSEILKEEDVVNSLDPFNVAAAGYVYRVASPDLTEFIEDSNDPEHAQYLSISMSWEVGFNSFKLVVGSQTLADSEIIDDEKEIEKLESFLIGNGGRGKLEDGRQIHRLITKDEEGNYPIVLGVGLTLSPAAAVKGVVVSRYSEDKKKEVKSNMKSSEKFNNLGEILDQTKAKQEQDSGQEPDIEENNKQKQEINLKNVSQEEDKTVKDNKMKKLTLDSIAELKKLTDENVSQFTIANIKDLLEQEIEKVSKEWEGEVEKEKNKFAEAQKQIEKTEKGFAELKENLENTTKELEELKKAQVEIAAQNLFNERMTHLDSEYELNEEDRKVIVSQIKGLDDDQYENWFEGFSKLANEKLKTNIAKKAEEQASKVEEAVKAVTASDDKTANEDKKDKENKEENKETKASEDVLDKAKVSGNDLPNSASSEDDSKERLRKAFSKKKLLNK